MPYFEWQSDFETGVASVDQQHKRLVQLVNKLHDAVEDSLDHTQIQETLNELVDYTRFHFADEEQLMIELQDHDVTGHQRQHQFFVSELTNLMIKYGESGNLTGLQLTAFLKGWLQEHFLKEDRELIQQYAQHRRSARQKA